ncbi:microsomal glutathione S-transferase 1 isoform X2 [Prionailurus iriomotensis]
MVDLTELMENEVFMAFASYTTIILSKMMFMSTATAFFRLTRKVFANPEDCAGFGKGENAKKYLRTDDKVERVRRLKEHPLIFLAALVVMNTFSFYLENSYLFFNLKDNFVRAHLNDLENIVPFLGIGLLYSLSGPDLSTAILHFRLFVGARIYHTVAYLTPLPQPNRALAFFLGYGVTFSMAYRLLKSRLYL